MKKYKVVVKFITDYLQAKHSEDAKKHLEKLISEGIAKLEDDSWMVLIYRDDKGCYIPAVQFRQALVVGGKELKRKKQRSSMMKWVQSCLQVTPQKIYINNKQEPDNTLVSYPRRKDGSKVKIIHPVFNAGTQVEFEILNIDDAMEDESIEKLVVKAGKMAGVGARRSDMFGRFELVEFKKIT